MSAEMMCLLSWSVSRIVHRLNCIHAWYLHTPRLCVCCLMLVSYKHTCLCTVCLCFGWEPYYHKAAIMHGEQWLLHQSVIKLQCVRCLGVLLLEKSLASTWCPPPLSKSNIWLQVWFTLCTGFLSDYVARMHIYISVLMVLLRRRIDIINKNESREEKY